MKHLIRLFVLAMMTSTGNTAWSHGDVSCKTPKSEWRPSVELQRELKKQGWTVRKIQVENGCYEVYGFDEKDQRVEAWFDPKSFARVG